jgi:hypothetical protein
MYLGFVMTWLRVCSASYNTKIVFVLVIFSIRIDGVWGGVSSRHYHPGGKYNPDNKNIQPVISMCQSMEKRNYQEDWYVAAQIYNGYLIAVLDGHGGSNCM